MEEAPTPNKDMNKGKKIERMAQNIQDNLLYQVNFKKEGKGIKVECSNIYKDDENYSYKLMEKEIIDYFGDITNFMNKIDDADNIELKPEKGNGVLLLKIIFLDKNNRKEILELKMKEFKEEEETTIDDDINTLADAIKAIKLLREENKNIKRKLDTVEKNFNEYKEKMNLNFLYNSFEPFAYKLDDIYNALSSKDIIQNQRDFYLINQGIQHLFKKNIVFFECIYKSNNLNFEQEKFNKQFNNSLYSILVILTQDRERFGAFLKNECENNFNNNNYNNGPYNLINNQMNNQIQPNNLMNLFDYDDQMDNPWGKPIIVNKNKMSHQIIVFNSSSNGKMHFVFSLDNSQIYYSYNNFSQNLIPSFIIHLDNRALQGYEIPIKNALNINEYKLVKTPNFNIMEFELYSINLGYL